MVILEQLPFGLQIGRQFGLLVKYPVEQVILRKIGHVQQVHLLLLVNEAGHTVGQEYIL